MKVSEWLRQYQLTGSVPTAPEGEEMLAFWAGWLIGHSRRIELQTLEQGIEQAVQAAEFIEKHAKG